MQNIFIFSQYFTTIRNKLKFGSKITLIFFKLIFTKKRKLELVKLNYSNKHNFDKSILVIEYEFKNAIWFNLKNIKTTTYQKPILINIENITGNELTLNVYGFFQKKQFVISSKIDNTLITNSFKTKFSKFNNNVNFTPSLDLKISKPALNNQKIKVANQILTINNTNFNQTEFI